ncbi:MULTISPECIES: hypothetical protein [unclassified Microcoleus]|uniref:hypothetical protein n=1 Tax=unclassified Microcoleus TaxID=2642155 RepID=UPI002FD44A26
MKFLEFQLTQADLVCVGSISPLQPSARNWSFEAGGRRQEAEGKRKKERGRRKEPEEGRSQKKYFYKYEMLPFVSPQT